MAIYKQASIQKKASAFKTYKVPIGPEGKPLKRNENNQYVLSDGVTLYDPSIHGKMRTKTRPLLNESDLMDPTNFPVQSKTLVLKKYQAIIQELRDAVKNAESGIVNFVIGNETDTADAILKSAFPPASGVVYKGVEGDGYEINAPAWGNIENAKASLTRLLKGNPKGVDRKSLEYYNKLVEEWNAGGVQSGRPTPPTPLSLMVPLNINARTPGGGAGTADPDEVQAAKMQKLYQIMEGAQAGMEKAEDKIREISDIHDMEPDQNDPEGLSPSEQYKKLIKYINYCNIRVAECQKQLPQDVTYNGEAEYDGTGFIDYGNPEKMYSQLYAPVNVPEFTGEAGNQLEAYKRQVNAVQSSALKIVRYIKMDAISNGAMEQPVNTSSVNYRIADLAGRIEKILLRDNATLQSVKEGYKKAIYNLCGLVKTQNTVLVVNNLQQSSLARLTDQGGLQFLADDVLAQHFSGKQSHKNKAIVLVTRVPIKIGVGTVTVVPKQPNAFLVDDEEGEVLVRYYIDLARKLILQRIQESKAANISTENMPSLSLVDVSNNQIKTLAQLISNRTQVSARHFLQDLFNRIIDSKTGGLSGGALVKEGRTSNNDEIRNGQSWVSTAGELKPMFQKEARLTLDHYIYSKRTDWGSKVEEIHNIALTAASKEAYAQQLSDKIHAINAGLEPGTTRDIIKLETEIKQLEADIKTNVFGGIKHFIILYGAAGCGKSAYPEALANQLGFDLLDVDFGEARGGLVGQTEAFTHALLESWKRLTNVVIRLDELDGQLVSEEQEGRESYNANQTKQLLTFFQDHEPLLQERNIFVVATTNHLERIRVALKDRAALHEVPMPFDQEGYESFLKSAMDIMKANGKKMGLVGNVSTTISDDLWPETMEYWNSLEPEFPKMATALIPTGLNFRKLLDFIGDMFTAHRLYQESSSRLNLYHNNFNTYKKIYSKFLKINPKTQEETWPVPTITGFPFTADNFVKACGFTFPVNAKGKRVDVLANRDEVSHRSDGIAALKRQLNGIDKVNVPDQQQTLDFGYDNSSDLMPEMNDGNQTVASIDYYYQQLLKSGFINRSAQNADSKPAQTPTTQAPTLQAAPEEEDETPQAQLARIARGDIRDEDIIEMNGVGVYPIPNPKSLN